MSHTDTGKFQARIKLDGKRINLGSFDTAEDAAAAYRTAKASGFTCAESPQQNRVKRGTGLLAHVPCAALCTADLLRLLRFAGRKALIKKGLQPAFMNGLKPVVAYRNAYNLPAAGVPWPAPTPPACTQAAAPPLQLSWQPSCGRRLRSRSCALARACRLRACRVRMECARRRESGRRRPVDRLWIGIPRLRG